MILAACDPVWVINVKVHDGSKARPAPLADVEVVMCPEETKQINGFQSTTRTDAKGQTQFASVGGAPVATCSLALSKPGYRSQTVVLDAVCDRRAGAGCRRADIEAVMEPESPVTPSRDTP